MLPDSPDLRCENWGQNLVRSFFSACWPMGPLALTPSFLHSVLVDETVDYNNGQYIWDVCFSPDGRLLATGVGDGMVQVSFRALTMAIVFAVIIIFGADVQHSDFLRSRFGISPASGSTTDSGVTPGWSTRSLSRRTGDSSSLGLPIIRREFGI